MLCIYFPSIWNLHLSHVCDHFHVIKNKVKMIPPSVHRSVEPSVVTTQRGGAAAVREGPPEQTPPDPLTQRVPSARSLQLTRKCVSRGPLSEVSAFPELLPC